MTTLKFKCTLLSDVILNQNAATESPNSTLDFIPGSNFLGIVANKLYGGETPDPDVKTIVHSGSVRFGDAHLAAGNHRTLKIPADLFYPKLKKKEMECYVSHAIPDPHKLKDEQLKQCRNGFYDFIDSNNVKEAKAHTNFAIKSAHDRHTRTSKDQQMYGYESLCKGLEFYFSVEFDDNAFVDKIRKYLIGDHNIGRSRSAQYGRVNIEECNAFEEYAKLQNNADEIIVYADGRLIFLDEYGLPTFIPTAQQLGLECGTIDIRKSQVRTFQYAPWNFARQCFDADRCGIEKGSVFVVKNAKISKNNNGYVGSYKNEGFGKVIYNPAFLNADQDGKITFKFAQSPKPKHATRTDDLKSQLGQYLLSQYNAQNSDKTIYELVNEFTSNYHSLFEKGERWASQFGEIRSIATRADSMQIKDKIEKYIGHGVAKEKWDKRKRGKILLEFFDKLKEKSITGESLRLAVINLAAEMAKKINH